MTRETLEYWRASARGVNVMTMELIDTIAAQQEEIDALKATMATVSQLLELLPAELWQLS